MSDLIVAIIFLIICYFTGKTVEKNHYKKIRERELLLYRKPYISFSKNVNTKKPVKKSTLVASSVVIGCDHFKAFLAGLKNIFGGNVSAFESVMDRGRREALLRIREYALAIKADIVMNIKIDTVMLNPLGSSKNPQVCITAYGTAIEYDKQQ